MTEKPAKRCIECERRERADESVLNYIKRLVAQINKLKVKQNQNEQTIRQLRSTLKDLTQ